MGTAGRRPPASIGIIVQPEPTVPYDRGIILLASLVIGVASLPGQEVSRTPLVLKQGGTAEKPAVFDGKGMVIDLGIDVTGHAWRKDGDLWTSTARLAAWDPVAPGIFTGLFIDELPLAIAIDQSAQAKREKGDERNRYLPPSAIAPGQMGVTDAGLVYFRWPAGRSPDRSRLFIPPKPATSAVSIECSHIIVRNLTAMHAANDGFNIHGGRTGIRLENIKALSNADEGISAHDTVEMQVVDSEIAWNASYDGGVVDAGDSVTSYDRCTVHDNPVGKAAAFKFFGGKHRVTNTVIWNQKIDFRLNGQGEFSKENITNRGTVAP